MAAELAHPADTWRDPLRELDAETITGWRADLAKKGLGTESQRKALKLLRGVLQRGLEWKRIPDNPATLSTYAHVFEEFEDVERTSAEEAIQRARGKSVPSEYLLEQRA